MDGAYSMRHLTRCLKHPLRQQMSTPGESAGKANGV